MRAKSRLDQSKNIYGLGEAATVRAGLGEGASIDRKCANNPYLVNLIRHAFGSKVGKVPMWIEVARN